MSAEELPFAFYFDVLRALEEIEAPYVVIGGFMASIYGSSRATFDIDIVVDLQETHMVALAARYPPPRYYADVDQMRDSTRLGILFNLIDTERGRKVDLIPLSMERRYVAALARRVRRVLRDDQNRPLEIWGARPEEVILGKLMAWVEGHQDKHEQDIYSMMVFLRLGVDPTLSVEFDEAEVDRQATWLGPEAAELWDTVKAAVWEAVESERANQ